MFGLASVVVEQAEREAKAAAKKREMEKKRMAAHSGLRPVPPEEMFEPFTLYLESVLVLPGRGCVARISGRSARVGEAIPGLDPKNPPVFDSVKEASTVVVRHRGTLYSLDLSKKRKVTIGPRGVQ